MPLACPTGQSSAFSANGICRRVGPLRRRGGVENPTALPCAVSGVPRWGVSVWGRGFLRRCHGLREVCPLGRPGMGNYRFGCAPSVWVNTLPVRAHRRCISFASPRQRRGKPAPTWGSPERAPHNGHTGIGSPAVILAADLLNPIPKDAAEKRNPEGCFVWPSPGGPAGACRGSLPGLRPRGG